MQSPFTPYLGKVPKAFINREKETKDFSAVLSDASLGKPISILLTGQRGYGKTVLLKYLGGIAGEKGFTTVYIALDESVSDLNELTKRIYSKVRAALEEEFIDLRGKKFLKRLSPHLTFKLHEFELQLSASLSEEDVNKNNFAQAFGKLIKKKKVALFFDETQSILKTKGIARFLVNTFYAELPDYASNWLCIFAGIPVLENKILEATPADRAFHKMALDCFSFEESRKVLQETAKGTLIHFTKDACRAISADCEGIPYYLQFFGDKLFTLKGKGTIAASFYAKKKHKIIEELGKTVFDRRLKELEKRGHYYKILQNIARFDKGEGASFKYASKGVPSYIGPYIKELEEKNYIVKVERGLYKAASLLFKQWICSSLKIWVISRSSG